MDGLLALAIVAAHAHTEIAYYRASDTQFELVLDNRLQRRQRLFEIRKKARQARAGNQDVLDSRWNKEMVVRRVDHGACPGESICQIQPRTEMASRRRQAVTVEANPDVRCEFGAELQRVLQICATLSPGFPAGKRDGCPVRCLHLGIS